MYLDKEPCNKAFYTDSFLAASSSTYFLVSTLDLISEVYDFNIVLSDSDNVVIKRAIANYYTLLLLNPLLLYPA